MVGVFSVKSLEDYHVDPLKESIAIAAAATGNSIQSIQFDFDILNGEPSVQQAIHNYETIILDFH